jgi:hypothetical protein
MRAFDATEMSRILATVQALPREAQSTPKAPAMPKAAASKNGAKAGSRTKAKAGVRRR